MADLRIVLIKPSKYTAEGAVERFKVGFMPNATLHHVASLTPRRLGSTAVQVITIDEYVRTDLDYLRLLHAEPGIDTLLGVVGVQSHQFHRALDLCAYARAHGVRHCVIGGPHPMTCDTSELQGRGVSFALAEAELIWPQIVQDAIDGGLAPVYGAGRRWAVELDGPIIDPPDAEDLKRYWAPMLGIYPVRGCPYTCNYCSVIKISGRRVRSPALSVTMESLRRAKAAGIDTVMFTSDNFNKFPEVMALLDAMIAENLGLRFFCQCDTLLARQPELIEALARAGCFEIFVGVESFSRATLKAAHKYHNRPADYATIVRLCREAGIRAHFSNIIGFPDDTEESIAEQLAILKALNPQLASFWILTPIPGTEQYDDFLARGLIWEKNLDRFDGSCPTWSHPSLSPARLSELLFHCYADFYRHVMANNELSRDDLRLASFNRYAAQRRQHPLSGGIGMIAVDGVDDYRELRRDCFGIELAPLPRSLELPAADRALNRGASWTPSRGSGAGEGPARPPAAKAG